MTTYHHSRDIAAAPAAVFDAIRNPERLARWWGPDGFTNTFERFEFRPGGQWVFTMHGPDGKSYPNQATFSRIEPDLGVCIRHTCAPYFDLNIGLEAIPSGTRVTWVQRFDDAQVGEAVRHIVEPANEQNLTRLANELAAPVA
jgi:carbon monoxide dehydrogenase subunit G